MQKLALLLVLVVTSCSHAPAKLAGDPKLKYPGEVNLENVRQLTHGGTNAEAYWSFDGQWLSFQHKGDGIECDQIFRMRSDGSEVSQVSNGKGRTTCSYYFPDRSRVLYSSTFATDEKCPAAPDMSRGYVWPIYDSYQMYSAKPDGSDVIPMEPGAPRAYNAEATLCHDGSVVFTSDRDGDLDLYTAKLDPMGTMTGVKRVTKGLGYDGGAFFSADCKHLVWRASRPRKGKEAEEYVSLLKQHLVRPTQLEIWTGDADGSHAHQVTKIGAASFAPFFTPDGKHIIFASNPRDPHGRHFDLYLVNVNGTGLRRVTFSDTFESFPMFSPDGKTIAFSSNRNATQPHETNVFVADWAMTPDQPVSADDTNAANRFQAVVEKLADPALEGRAYGSKGSAMAVDYVSGLFAKLGVKPFFEVFHRPKDGVGYEHHTSMKGLQSDNVVGVLGGSCGRTAPVIVGAHIDHLGYGDKDRSLEPSASGIHPGADDNASGVAAMVEVARELAGQTKLLKSSCFIFAGFTGEETAIVGSSRLASLLIDDMKIHPKAMINMDMVGRMQNNRLIIYGTDSAREWAKLVEDSCAEHQLECPGGGDGYGPSDHMSFFVKHVPVVYLFTGPHADYHRTTDTPDKINATGGVQAAEVAADLAARVARPGQTLHYQKATGNSLMGEMKSLGSGHGHLSRAYLGTIPDYSRLSSPHGPSGAGAEGGGVWLSGARPGSPADKAGVKEGDILRAIDDKPINTLEEFMKVLGTLQPGQQVTLEVKRGESVVRLPAEVGTKDN